MCFHRQIQQIIVQINIKKHFPYVFFPYVLPPLVLSVSEQLEVLAIYLCVCVCVYAISLSFYMGTHQNTCQMEGA
jgi:Ca2+/H+ antiporter